MRFIQKYGFYNLWRKNGGLCIFCSFTFLNEVFDNRFHVQYTTHIFPIKLYNFIFYASRLFFLPTYNCFQRFVISKRCTYNYLLLVYAFSNKTISLRLKPSKVYHRTIYWSTNNLTFLYAVSVGERQDGL